MLIMVEKLYENIKLCRMSRVASSLLREKLHRLETASYQHNGIK